MKNRRALRGKGIILCHEAHPLDFLFLGLQSHPQHELAKKQMKGFGGMVSFFIKGNVENAKTFLTTLKVLYGRF